MKMRRKLSMGFTLIELLVVIAIIGVLMGIVGPKVFDLLITSEKTKHSAIVNSWVTSLVGYKSHYGYFPPFLYENEEGVPVLVDSDEQHDSFLASMKGKSRNGGSGAWESLSESLQNQNTEMKEFHSFTENEFKSDGKIIGYGNLHILIDQDGDGSISLGDDIVDDILDSLSQDYSADQIDDMDRDLFGVVNQPIIIFVIQNPTAETDEEEVVNVFSWNIEKYFD
jgi:prepilin-type N-terminal cleavage/methylation domain-containing protein